MQNAIWLDFLGSNQCVLPKTKLALKGNVTLPRCVGHPAHHSIHSGRIPPLGHARGTQQVLQNITLQHGSPAFRAPTTDSCPNWLLCQSPRAVWVSHRDLPERHSTHHSCWASSAFPGAPLGMTEMVWGDRRRGFALPFIGASPTHPN